MLTSPVTLERTLACEAENQPDRYFRVRWLNLPAKHACEALPKSRDKIALAGRRSTKDRLVSFEFQVSE